MSVDPLRNPLRPLAEAALLRPGSQPRLLTEGRDDGAEPGAAPEGAPAAPGPVPAASEQVSISAQARQLAEQARAAAGLTQEQAAWGVYGRKGVLQRPQRPMPHEDSALCQNPRCPHAGHAHCPQPFCPALQAVEPVAGV